MRNSTYLIITIGFLLTGCEKMLLGPEPGNTPEENFNILWKTLDEKYALFPVKDVNWDSLYTVYHSRINSGTTEEELWTICREMIENLNDGHVTLFNRNCARWCGSRVLDESGKSLFNITNIMNNYLVDVNIVAEGYITYGKIKGTNYGYIYVSSFHAVPSGKDWRHEFDIAIRDLYDTDALIIDVRNNPGGFARNDLYFASFFIDHEFVYYYTKMKNGPGHNDFAAPEPWTITMREDTLSYTKRNVLLTNRFSGSGSEAFALILKPLSYSVQIGDTTNGSFGATIHTAQLPNGWAFWFPETLTILPDGTSPEGIGVIPDIYVNNTNADIDRGADKVLEEAVRYLRGE